LSSPYDRNDRYGGGGDGDAGMYSTLNKSASRLQPSAAYQSLFGESKATSTSK
jgi:hypothetical protein